MTASEIISALRQAAEEIAREGHAGWGILCSIAADELQRLAEHASAPPDSRKA